MRAEGGRRALVLAILLLLTAPLPVGQATTLPAGSDTAPFSCSGPHDLLVVGGQRTLEGDGAFDRVCVQGGGILAVTANLTLRAGALYVAPDGAIAADGQSGAHDCPSVGGTDVQLDGAAGYALTILTREAIIGGKVSANGGTGGGTDTSTCPKGAAGNGGAGGAVTVEAITLTLRGQLSAVGGRGAQAGAGGSITVVTAHPDVPAIHRRIRARHVAIGRLTAAQQAVLPPLVAAPVLVTTLGAPPIHATAEPPAVFSRGMECGPGDLRLDGTTTMRLSGTHTYAHVCLEGHAALKVGAQLTLLAQTILVAPQASIDASGVITTAARGRAGSGTGRPGDRADRSAPPAGGVGASSLTYGPDCSPCPGASGGAGGGTVSLVARRILVAGTVKAAGAAGTAGAASGSLSPDNAANCSPATDGGDGGAGGGILVVADEVQMSGRLSVAGGVGGPGGAACDPGSPGGNVGAPGSAGLIKVFAGILRAAGPLPVNGRAVVGHILPVDPVPPPAAGMSSVVYVATTHHTLRGAFLAFFQRFGGLGTFGYPRTEQFSKQGQLVQYTDRALLQLAGGRVATAPLGRVLTAGRSFPRVTRFASTATRVYVDSTGHSLSGQFLIYWRSHQGTIVLGAPIAEPTREQNGDGTGRMYLVQWFEKGRLEYHPELAGTRYAVEAGLVGKQALLRDGWL